MKKTFVSELLDTFREGAQDGVLEGEALQKALQRAMLERGLNYGLLRYWLRSMANVGLIEMEEAEGRIVRVKVRGMYDTL